MRNKSAVMMIAVSVVMGLIAVVVAAQWLGQQASLATNQVVVAAREIQLGSPLTPDMLRTVEWPRSSLPDGAIQNEKDLDGRVVKTSLQRGEPILESKLAPVGTKGGLSSVISEGKRAITVKVNEVIGVAGFALPGNLVDVMVNTKDENEKPISKIVLEQILVLAVAQEANRDETKPKVVSAVTLEVTPEQAEKLDLARSVGNLSLVLRNQLDKDGAMTDGARKNDLLQTVAAPEPPKPQPQPQAVKLIYRSKSVKRAPATPEKNKVEMIKGVHKSSVEF
jgi:pilus assembly protein CpaB